MAGQLSPECKKFASSCTASRQAGGSPTAARTKSTQLPTEQKAVALRFGTDLVTLDGEQLARLEGVLSVREL
jgi:hypothetical protein